jgi:ABC-type oligopeptide transport system ATPase subunit
MQCELSNFMIAVTEHISHRIAVMYLSKIVGISEKTALLTTRSTPVSGRSVVQCRSRRRSSIILKGDLPSPINPLSGWRFHTRCPTPSRRRSKEEPEMREVLPATTWLATCATILLNRGRT